VIKGNDFNLAVDPRAQRVQKKPMPVVVCFADSDGVCQTKEGGVSFKAGDAILTGVEGEQWPIIREKFNETYEPVNPTKKDSNGKYVKKPILVYALQMDEPFYVHVSWADDRIEGQPGDWLLQYGHDDYGVVSETIFDKTYQIIK